MRTAVSALGGQSYEAKIGRAHRIASVHFRYDLPNVFWSHDPVMDEDTPNHQNSLFSLHLAADIAAKCPTACFDVARCQGGGKRAP